MTITTVDGDLCDGCALCIESCPTDVLRMDGANKAVIAYPNDCMSCFLCDLDCPRGAIQVSPEIPLPFLPAMPGERV